MKQMAGTLITLSGAGLWGLNAVVSKYLMSRGIETMWMVNFRMITAGAVLRALYNCTGRTHQTLRHPADYV